MRAKNSIFILVTRRCAVTWPCTCCRRDQRSRSPGCLTRHTVARSTGGSVSLAHRWVARWCGADLASRRSEIWSNWVRSQALDKPDVLAEISRSLTMSETEDLLMTHSFCSSVNGVFCKWLLAFATSSTDKNLRNDICSDDRVRI